MMMNLVKKSRGREQEQGTADTDFTIAITPDDAEMGKAMGMKTGMGMGMGMLDVSESPNETQRHLQSLLNSAQILIEVRCSCLREAAMILLSQMLKEMGISKPANEMKQVVFQNLERRMVLDEGLCVCVNVLCVVCVNVCQCACQCMCVCQRVSVCVCVSVSVCVCVNVSMCLIYVLTAVLSQDFCC